MKTIIMVGVLGFLTALAPSLLAREEDPAEKAAKDWLYPGATWVSSSITGTDVFCVVQETADDVPKIMTYYGDKLHVTLKQDASSSGRASDHGVPMDFVHVGSHPSTAGGTVTVSTFKTKTAVSTLVVSRYQDSKLSKVIITHVLQNAAK